MSLKRYHFSGAVDLGVYLLIFGVVPLKAFQYLSNHLIQINDGLTTISVGFFIVIYMICIIIFNPMFINSIEVRSSEIRFFKPFSNRWAPIQHYRFIADGPDFKKVIVYKRNCKNLGKIGLKRANAEEKMEFLKIIEPYLTVRGVGSDFSLTDVKD